MIALRFNRTLPLILVLMGVVFSCGPEDKTISGSGGTTVTIGTTPLADGTVSSTYSDTLTASGGTTPYTWFLMGILPPGLTLNSSTGTISGTPTTANTYVFTIVVQDSTFNVGSQSLAIVVYDALSITTTTIPAAVQGKTYSTILSATGGQTPYTWALQSGTLPGTLDVNPNGTITGSTTGGDTPGDYSVVVEVTDAASRTDTQTLALTLNTGITLSPTTLPDGTAGTAYDQTLTASGGSPDYSCSVSNGSLPTSLVPTDVPPDTCTITGTPTEAGVFPFQITATDMWSATGAQNYTITIKLGMSTTTLPDASVAAGTYSVDLTTYLLGETGATTWSVTSPPLPMTGLTLTPAGVLSGTPDALDIAGSPYTFDVDVADSATTPNTETFTLSISIVP